MSPCRRPTWLRKSVFGLVSRIDTSPRIWFTSSRWFIDVAVPDHLAELRAADRHEPVVVLEEPVEETRDVEQPVGRVEHVGADAHAEQPDDVAGPGVEAHAVRLGRAVVAAGRKPGREGGVEGVHVGEEAERRLPVEGQRAAGDEPREVLEQAAEEARAAGSRRSRSRRCCPLMNAARSAPLCGVATVVTERTRSGRMPAT